MSDSEDAAFVRLEIDGPVARIVLDRPQKLGALTAGMLARLEQAADTIDRDPSVRVALLLATGEKAFCVGADILAWSALHPLEMGARWVRDGHRVFDRLAGLRQPLIAVLNGMAFGGGLELAMTADIRIAEAHATLGLPEVSIGAIPGWGGTGRLPALIGAARAKQMIFTAGRIDAATAERWGLVNEVVPSGEGAARAEKLAAEIARQAPRSVQIAKQAVNAGLGFGTAAALEALAGALAATTEDGREGAASFRERRPPDFRGI
jgi:enoyl-CoA hydratase/carnithine racemase